MKIILVIAEKYGSAILFLLVGFNLFSCMSESSNGGVSPSGTSSAVSGIVMGGVIPIVGSRVTLYEANNIAGGTPLSLGTGITDAQGKFSISFINPDGSSILYLVARGGDAGNGSNSAIQLALMLGPASNLSPNMVTVNEVTTVSVGYAMNSFIQGSIDHFIAGPSPFFDNASATSLTLVDPTTGVVNPSLDSDAQNMINGVADILAFCVGGTPSNCSTLFTDTTRPDGYVPTDTLSSLLIITQYPANNVSTLWGLIGASPPYTTSGAPPSSLSLMLIFPQGGIASSGIAVDTFGNIWVANEIINSVTKIPKGANSCNSGCINFTGGGISRPQGIAIDTSGNVWVTNYPGSLNGLGSVTEIPKGATSCSSSCINFTGGGINGPNGIAADASGNVWVANNVGSSVTEILNGATSCSQSCINFNEGQFFGPAGIAVDSSGNVWVANASIFVVNNNVTEILKGATSCSTDCIIFNFGQMSGSDGIAVDSLDNVWVTNPSNYSVTEILKGATSCFQGCINISGGGIYPMKGIAVDSLDNVWVTNTSINSVTEIPQGTTSCSSGCINFTGGAFNQPLGIAADSSGNVWVANYGTNVTEIPNGSTSCSPNCIIFSEWGVSGPLGIALDGSGNVWVASNVNDSVVEIPKGTTSCSSGCFSFTGGGISRPHGIAADGFGNVWVANESSSVTKIPIGAVSCSSDCLNFTGGGIIYPEGIAVDGTGNVWVASSGSNSVVEIPKGATSCSSSCINFTGGGINGPNGIAVDASGNVWVANNGNSSVTEIPKGASSCSSGCINFTGGGINGPIGIAIDATGNVWIFNSFGGLNGRGSITEIPKGVSSCSSGCINFSDEGINSNLYGMGIAVDGTGNVWVASNGSNSVVEIPKGTTSCSLSCISFTGGGIIGPRGIAVDTSGNVWITNGGSRVTEIIGTAASTQIPL